MKFNLEKSEHLFFERLGSTNEHLQKLNKSKNLSEGTVVWTNFQTHGRGHGKNIWESEAGKNLLMSILLKPSALPATDQFKVSKIISLSLAGLVMKHVRQVTVKWPNDILAGNSKIAGILIENTILDNNIRESIAGIGLNVNQVEFPVYIPDPTSLKKEAGCHFDILEILKDLIQHIELWYGRLLDKEFNMIDKRYEEMLFGMGEVLEFEENGRPFSARITGVGPTGQLQLEMKDGKAREFGFKEVVYRL